MNILFLSTRQAKPSFRFRVEQILPDFRQRGCETEVAFLPHRMLDRLRLYRTFREFDAVFVQKRTFSRFELHVIRRCAQRLIYDVDDAVMFDNQGRRRGRRFARYRAIVRAADLVICGNRYLAEQTRAAGVEPVVIPTAIDTDAFHPRLRSSIGDRTDTVTIGWTGSRSTNRYLNDVFPVLARVREQVGDRLRLKFISDAMDDLDFDALGGVSHQHVTWSPAVEVNEAATFDVGLMPLPDDPWSRGKCGFKALQYMALGVPAVCSPVGVNCEIVAPGRNGFLPADRDEWFQTLFKLIDNRELRNRVGAAGRKRVEEQYALKVVGPQIVDAVERTSAVRGEADVWSRG